MEWGYGSVELGGASGREWSLEFSRLLWPTAAGSGGGASTVHAVKGAAGGGRKRSLLVAKRQIAADERHLEELIDEAATWRAVGAAPNVVQLHDVFVQNGPDELALVFLMEYCPKGNAPRRGGMPEDHLVSLAADVTDAIESIIESGAAKCHGNICYDSVLIAADGTAKLQGFGASRIDARAANPSMDERDDAAAVGCLLFELATGKRPGRSRRMPADAPYSRELIATIDDAMNKVLELPELRHRLVSLKRRQIDAPDDQDHYDRPRAQPPAPPAVKASLRDIAVSSRPEPKARDGTFGADARKGSLFEVLETRPPPQQAREGRRSSLASDDFAGFKDAAPSLEANVLEATDEQAVMVDTAAMQWIAEAIKASGEANEVFRKLFKRPISNNPLVAFKAVCLVHYLIIHGPPDFWLLALRQDKFLEWVQSSWSREAIAGGGAGSAHPKAARFSGGEIAFFAAFLRMKARFHHRSAGAWNGDWTRSDATTDDGRDPLLGRQRKILTGMSELFETAEELVGRLLEERDDVRALRLGAVASFAEEISKSYVATCEMIDTAESISQRRKMEDRFAAIHACAKKSLDGIRKSKQAAALCSSDTLLQLDTSPPDIVGMVQPEPPIQQRPPEPPPFEELGSPKPTFGEEMAARDAELEEGDGKKKKKKKKKDKKAVEEETVVEDVVDAAGARPESPPQVSNENGEGEPEENSLALVVPGENQFGDLLNLEREPEPEIVQEERPDPEMNDTDLLAGMLGESAEAAAMLKPSFLALPAPGDDEDEDGEPRQVERPSYQASRAQIRTETMEMAIIAVDSIRPIDKLHPSFCQCSMCETCEAVQNIALGTAQQPEQSNGERSAPINLKAKLKKEFEVTPKEVKLGDKLGEGAFGTVYKGRFKNKVCAIKILSPEVLQNKHAVREFKSEIKVLAATDHPNILKFYGACTKPPQFMMVLEFAPRGTLFDVLYKGQLTLNWVLQKKIAMDICHGMQYLHATGLLHRDLKSTNLMLDTNFSVKVGDFGLAKLIEESDPKTQGLAGTYQYMAPEVIAHEPFTEKSDVYAFGMVLWELMARQLPYYGMDPLDVAQAVLHEGLRPPMPPCPQPVAVLIQSCWDANPFKRPTFTQALEILEKLPG